MIPEHFQEAASSESLVIELVVNARKKDEVAFSTSYKLYREVESWTAAEAHCKSEGGQLASIHSKEEQALAEEAAGDEYVLLGGRRVGTSEWNWSDNSSWGFTNWASGSGNRYDNCLVMQHAGEWSDALSCGSIWWYSFLCQGDITVTREKGLTRFEMKKDQLKFSPFYVTFKSQGISKENINSSGEEIRRTGFTLNWFLKDINGSQLTEKLAPRQEDWEQEFPTPNYKQPVAEMVQLARQLRLQNMTEEEIL